MARVYGSVSLSDGVIEYAKEAYQIYGLQGNALVHG